LMDRQMSEKFLDIFNRVNGSFQEVFKNMFPDGKAQLILTDPDDIMNTGIEIEAQPSGRRLKKVSLLSGGESAMTALALLFGLFQINPAPFYLLDEADVALDDVNLQRFVALIKRFKTQAQFLIVTHQRRTMEVADILYGVTMQKDGVSKVISQKLEES
jgi:chromosome segregation protein